MDNIKFTNADAFAFMEPMGKDSVELVLTDIPYGVVNRKSGGLRNLDKGKADELDFDLDKLVSELVRICSGTIYVFCSTEQVSELRSLFVEKGLTTRLMIWEKTNPSPMNGQLMWLSSVECAIFARKKNATFNEHCKSSVLRFPTVRGKIHPTQKSLDLFKYLVGVSSNPGDTVFDPFAGSGTTLIAAYQLGRKALGCELDPEFARDAAQRIKEHIND